MTRKHFEAIAAILADLHGYPNSTIDYDNGFEAALDLVAYRLADYCEVDNPRFDRLRFLTACGLGAKVVS